MKAKPRVGHVPIHLEAVCRTPVVDRRHQGVRAQGDDALDVSLCTNDELPEVNHMRRLNRGVGHAPIHLEAVCRTLLVELYLQGVRAQGDDALDVGQYR